VGQAHALGGVAVIPEKPTKSPAEIVEALEQKIDKEYPDLPTADQQPAAPAEDADPEAASTEANTVEPPD
jgi:hypothetical protein